MRHSTSSPHNELLDLQTASLQYSMLYNYNDFGVEVQYCSNAGPGDNLLHEATITPAALTS